MMSSKCLPDDKPFNIAFVQAVEKHPCLYDNTLKAYGNRSEQDRAWDQIAKVYFSTGTECKKKWKILRGSLTRYMKHRTGKSGCSAKSVKQYYLWDTMQFVLPFTKSRSQSNNLPNAEDELLENDESNADEDEDSNPNYPECAYTPNHQSQVDLDYSDNSAQTPSLSNRSPTKRKAPRKQTADEMENSITDCLSENNTRQPENPDLDFFKSILPDVGALTASQKRIFKVKVLQTLESLSHETETSRIASTSSLNDRPTSSSSISSSDIGVSNISQIHNNYTSDPSNPIRINEYTHTPNYKTDCASNKSPN